MSEQDNAYGQRLGEAFHLEAPPVLVSTTLKKSAIAITELHGRQPDLMTDALPIEDAYLIGHQVKACPDHELWLDGRSVRCQPFAAGVTSFYDLRQAPRAYIREASHCYMYYISRSVLDFVADENEAHRVSELAHPPGVGAVDPVMRHLTAALAPAFRRPEAANRLFVDHITLAVCTHLAATYGGLRLGGAPRGGLALWQERRAKAIIDAHLDGEISVAWLAQECALSTGHFAQAFRLTTGTTPHRWLLQRRIEVATDLMRSTALPLAEIFPRCGFADERHFCRVFTQITGATPGAWRRHYALGLA